MKKTLVVHPFLFALFPLLAIVSGNMREVNISQAFWPVAILVGATAVLLPLLRLVSRNFHKAGVVLTCFWTVFFFFGHVKHFLVKMLPRAPVALAVGLELVLTALVLLVWVAARRTRRKWDGLTKFLNIMGAILVLLPLVTIVRHELRAAGDRQDVVSERLYDLDTIASAAPETLPDIYFIVPDRYANEHTLRDVFGFDNAEFLDALRARGFYVASKSIGNYARTHLSLPSTFNLQYINGITDIVRKESYYRFLREQARDHLVGRFLKSKGYRLYHMGSWWEVASSNPYADVNITRSGMGELPSALWGRTMLYPVFAYLGFGLRNEHRARVLWKLDQLKRVAREPGPKFVFAIFVLPHQPYVFNRDGSYPDRFQLNRQTTAESYVNQLVFTNIQLLALVDTILAVSETPPIIVLQSDEGPHPNDCFEPRDELTNTRAKFRVLNALRLPGADSTWFHPRMSPVNTWRVIFDRYFGTGFGLLEDRSFDIDYESWTFFELTDKSRID
ncbi:MAG: hypothetical protein JSU73_04165 [candidate division WOR-3 bacterium]|nr:MAG: hypothetical protein JSU73_04165 [candidate division WOR-3 bacterium]